MPERNVIVVGAGLAGLCCARTIQRAGHIAHVYEAGNRVGGRVQTDSMDGFKLDRGFQVILTAYPAIRQEIDLGALNLCAFAPGARIYHQGEAYTIADPLRQPAHALSTAATPLFGIQDKLQVARLTAMLYRMSVEEIFAMPDRSMGDFLHGFGFSAEFLDRFIRPFYGGIFLEKEMETSVRMFAFVFKMFAEGQTAVPAMGMGALSQQLADGLAPDTLHLNSPVRELLTQGERVVGVQLEDGNRIEGDRVVLATEFDAAAQLARLHLPATWRVSTTLYFALPAPLYRQKMVALNTRADSLVNNFTMVSNVAPSYAPSGRHLLSVTVLGSPALSDEELSEAVKAELISLVADSDPAQWQLLKVYRIRQAQYAQPPEIWKKLPDPHTPRPGLILAGEITVSSSLHGALVSGQRAAGLALSGV